MKRMPDPRRIEVMDGAMAEVMRRKTPAERVAITLDANRTMRLLIEAAVRRAHPGYSDDQVRREVARRLLGESG